MFVYNLGAVVVLGVAGVQSQAVGVALLLAVVLHVIMAAWCIRALIKEPTYVVEKSSSISHTARAFGFKHIGQYQYSSDYRQLFGETPFHDTRTRAGSGSGYRHSDFLGQLPLLRRGSPAPA